MGGGGVVYPPAQLAALYFSLGPAGLIGGTSLQDFVPLGAVRTDLEVCVQEADSRHRLGTNSALVFNMTRVWTVARQV